MADPSSFVSTLTSLHLHLTEPKRELAGDDQTQASEDVTDLFSTSFGFPDSDFGTKTGLTKPDHDPTKPDRPSGRSFPDVQPEEDSKSDESRNNFFANPFQFNDPIFGSPNPGFTGQQANPLSARHSTNPGFTGQAAAGSAKQETLSRDGDHHGGGGYHVSTHDDGGYEAPHHDSGGYGAPVHHDDGGYGAPAHHDSGGYGHAEPVYHDEGGYGGDVHHEGGYSSHPGYTPTRHPGPYGYPTPNFKCEYVKETLYVSKSDWTYDEKCFTIYKTQCRFVR